MTSLVNPLSETTSYAYTNDGLVATQTDSNSTSSALVYNALNQLVQITNFDPSSTILSKFSSISHDASGNIIAKYDSVPGLSTLTGWNNNTYDSTDQLYTSSSARTATNMNYSYTFGMDSVGNFSTIRSLSYVYNTRNEINHSGFAYDYNGNPTTWRGGTVTYDPENHLTSYVSVTCTYRADGLRASRTASSATTYYIYDPSGNLLYEATSAGGVTAAYTWGPNGLVSRHISTGTNWYQFDERGNTADRTNSTGAVIEYHGSDPYGVVYDSAASSDPYKGFGAQYGYYYDSTFQMYLCGQRYYDPTYGRFINQDPIGFAGGINLFGYVSNNPFGATDPHWLIRNQVGMAQRILDRLA